MRFLRNSKILISVIAVLLVIALLPLSSVIASQNKPLSNIDKKQSKIINVSQIDFENIKNKLLVEYPELADGELLGIDENEKFLLVYDKIGADIFVYDKRTEKIWSNSYSASKYNGEFYNKMFLSQLFNVRVANAKGNIDQFTMIDNDELSDFDVTFDTNDRKLNLSINLDKKDIEFEISFWLDDDGLMYSIPKESIKEKSENTIIGITVMPSFGAAKSSEDGYIFYPDGSGSIMEFQENEGSNITSYTYSFYGTDEQDLTLIENNKSQEIYNMMLPVFGIKHSKSGVFASIVEGSEDSDLVIAPSGFQVSGLYRSYFTFNYKVYATQIINGKQSVKVVPDSIATTKTVKYFILDEVKNSYSDMALIYRNYLLKEKILQQTKKTHDIPVSLDFFMGITEKGMFLDNYLSLTTFNEVKGILEDLKSEGVNNIQVNLIAWGKGGYDNVPTNPSPATQIGGAKDLRKLMEYCDKNNNDLYLNFDYMIANKDSDVLSLRRDTVRDYFGNIISNDEETRYLINPIASWDRFINSACEKVKINDNVSFNIDKVGEILAYTFKNGVPASRYDVAKQYSKSLELIKKKRGKVSVSGGNMYVLPYADKIYNIPSRDSNYFNSDYYVPFYQMVVHGSVDYTSNAGNLNGELQTQILKWIENGSLPYFVLTQKSPEVLKNTTYTELYSSEYSQWKSEIVDIYKQFNSDFQDIWNKEIIKHTIISEDLKVIEYSDNTKVILNYSEKEIEFDGSKIEALSYLVLKR